MNEKRGSLHLLTGMIIGVLIGLLVSLVLLPVQYIDTEPRTLKESDRLAYREVVARAFLVEADTPRALARLALLQDANPSGALVEQAQTLLMSGGKDLEARALALLAAAVNQPSMVITPLAVVLPSPVLEVTSTTTAPALQSTITPTEILATRTPAATVTPRPTFTPQPTLGAPYELLEQSNVCDPEMKLSLIQVYVSDAAGKPVPGVKIEISQPNGGVETFFTGLYPEISPGYADYTMTQGMTYNLRVGEAGRLVLNLSIPVCEDDDGKEYPGSIRLDYQQPK